MLNLLRADLFTLKKSRSIFILMILSAVMSIALVLTLKYAVSNLPTSDIGGGSNKIVMGWALSNFEVYRFNGLYIASKIFGGNGNTIPALIGIFVCIFITSEFSNGTIKNILSKGYTKARFYLSKLIVVSVASVAIMLSMIAAAVIAGCTVFGLGTDTGISDIMDFLLRLIIQSFLHIAYASLFVMIAMLIKNMGGSIVISICVVALTSIIFPVISTLSKVGETVLNYWIDTNIVFLADSSLSINIIMRALLVGILFIVITTSIGMLFFTRQDVN